MNPRAVEALLIGILMSLGEMDYNEAALAAGAFLTSVGSGGRIPEFSDPISAPMDEEDIPEELQMHPEAALLDENDPEKTALKPETVQDMVYALSQMFVDASGEELYSGAQPLSPGVIAGLGTSPVGVIRHVSFPTQNPGDERPHTVEALFFFDIGTGALVKLAENHVALKEPPNAKKKAPKAAE